MVIKINEKEYELNFGIKFLRELDKRYFIEQSGVRFGTGTEVKLPAILSGDILALAEFIYFATVTEKTRPTMDDIDNYLDNAEDIDSIFSGVIDELKKHNATKTKVAQMEKILKEQEAALKTLMKPQEKLMRG